MSAYRMYAGTASWGDLASVGIQAIPTALKAVAGVYAALTAPPAAAAATVAYAAIT